MTTTNRSIRPALVSLSAAAVLAATGAAAAAPVVSRLTPPSKLFTDGNTAGPVVARFLPGQRFDLQATISPDAGQTITAVEFYVDGQRVNGSVALTAPTVPGFAAGSAIATTRAYSDTRAGVHTLSVVAQQSDGQTVTATGNFEIADLQPGGRKAKNIIICIGDGMGIAHRTAARIVRHGVSQGKADGRLAMDTMPFTGIVMTHSLNSIITDSSPGAACYSTGNKSNNNQQGVFPDDTVDNFDNPRVEHMGEFLYRTQGKTLGIVTTSDVFDATPGSFATHTSNRGAGTGICDQYIDDANLSGLRVLLGGGRKWFLPAGTPGSSRSNSNDYVLPADIVSAWGAQPGSLNAGRDLLSDATSAGWTYVADASQLASIPSNTNALLGLFAFSNMNVAKDKIDARRGFPGVVNDYGFPNQPMLPEMTAAAINVLSKNRNGFVLMVEAASIDKQAHNMDTERWVLDTIEFDDAISVAIQYAQQDPDTLVIVTADHECAGINIIGGSRVTDAELAQRAASGGGADALRTGVVGIYESAGFPRYEIMADGYPLTTDPDFKMLIGYAGNADRFEDWRTNILPNRDSQQPFNNTPPLSLYPGSPLSQDVMGNYMVTGQVPGSTAVHTGSDIPVSAFGRGAEQFTGVMDNTDVFFKAMQAAIFGTRPGR